MYQESEDDAPKWLENSSIAAPYVFTPENAKKLDEIRALLKLRNPDGHSPWKELFKNSLRKTDEDEANADQMLVFGKLSKSEQLTLSQTQRFRESQDSQLGGQSQVSSQTMESMALLKEALAQIDDSHKDCAAMLPRECLEIFVNCSPSQLDTLCTALEVDSLPYKALTVLFDEVIKFDKYLSLGWSIAFLQRSLVSRICNLQHVLPRFVLISIANFAAHFPRAAVDGFMIPCACSESFDRSQADLLSHLFKESLPVEHQNLFLKNMLHQCPKWNESTVSLMDSILKCKFEFSEELLDLLATQLVSSTHSLDNNLKFGKFMQTLIASLGRQFSPAHFDALTEVLDRNKTFLKKTCLTALAKFKR